MSDPFLSEIRAFPFGFVPKGWKMCNGELLPINTNQALFALLGTTYGGNGTTNFAFPDLRGLVAIHFDASHTLGQRAGEQAHTVSFPELPQHTHPWQANSQSASTNEAFDNVLAASNNLYANPAALTSINPGTVTNVGGGQAHTNMQPYLVLTFGIAVQGVFPSRN